MALTDKNIVVTPNIGSSNDPQIVFSGADASTTAQNVTIKAYPTSSGTLSFEASAGQLFSITNSLSGTLFSVNDISGIPSIEVLDTGYVKLAQYNGQVIISGTNWDGASKLQVNGLATFTGGTSGVIGYTMVTGATTLSDVDTHYLAIATSSFTITLPATSTNGRAIVISDGGNMSTYPITIGRNGKTIAGLSEDLIMNIAGSKAELVYYNGDWKMFAL